MSLQIQRPFASRGKPAAKPAPVRLWPPRNAQRIAEARAAGEMPDCTSLVVSFVDWTDIDAPHVFVDGGRRYDWRFAKGLHASIVAKPGIDARPVMRDLHALAEIGMAPYLIDLDSKLIGTIVSAKPLAVMVEPSGSYLWRRVFC